MNASQTKAPTINGTHIEALLRHRTSALVQRESGTVDVVANLDEALAGGELGEHDVVLRASGWEWADELLDAVTDAAREQGTSLKAATLRAAAGREGRAELAAEHARIESFPTVPVRAASGPAPVSVTLPTSPSMAELVWAQLAPSLPVGTRPLSVVMAGQYA